MNIILEQLRIKNFKGMVNRTITFGPETFIYGDNGTGKTTIADAWYWLLFGKNSTDDKVFNIKNTVETHLNKSDHEVEGDLLINGERTTLKRLYREKWQKKKGREIEEYTGNEQEFYWNGVPKQAREYQSKISSILDEELFKKITNPAYFNTMISWQDRRKTLIAMAGDVTLRDVAGDNHDFQMLLEKLGNESLEEYRKKLAARIAKLKEDLLHLPARIKELKESLPEPEPSFAKIEQEIKSLTDELNGIDQSLQSKSAALRKFQDEQADIQSKINKQNRDLADLKHSITLELQAIDRNNTVILVETKQGIVSLDKSIAQLKKDKEDAEKRISGYEKTLTSLRDEWNGINAEKFEYPELVWNEHEESCPTCKQHLPVETIDSRKTTLKANYDRDRSEKETSFNNNKARRLQDNKNSGTNAKVSKENMEANLTQIKESLTKKESELAALETKYSNLQAQYKAPAPIEDRVQTSLKENITAATIEAALVELKARLKDEPAEENAELKARKQEIVAKLGDLNKQLGQRDTILATKSRIERLMIEEKQLNQQRADAEREDDIRLRFEKARIEMIVSLVNGLFEYVTFKLFKEQVNGGEEPCCETMIGGVPYSDANTANKVKAGIDIINALSKNYNTWAPIFLDNRESVVRIPHTESQVINLVVSEPDKKLRIEAAAAMAEA